VGLAREEDDVEAVRPRLRSGRMRPRKLGYRRSTRGRTLAAMTTDNKALGVGSRRELVAALMA